MRPRTLGVRVRARPWLCGGGQARLTLTLALLLLLAVSGCHVGPTTKANASTPSAPATGALPTSLPQGSVGVAYLLAAPPIKKGETPAYSDLYTLRRGDGRLLWHQRLGPIGSVFPLAGERVLYLGSGSEQPGGQGHIEALRVSDGGVEWHSALQSGAVVPIAASGNAVFVEVLPPVTQAVPPYPPDTIEALRAGDGALLWKVTATTGAWATLGDSVLYLTPIIQGATASQNKYLLVALDTSDGKLMWQITLPRPQLYYQAPVLSNGVLFMTPQGTTQGSTPATALLAVRASDGHVLWQVTHPGISTDRLVVVADGTVAYLAWSPSSPASGIVAFHAQDGSLSWQFFSQASQPVQLVPSDAVLYALTEIEQSPSNQERLDAYAASSGTQLFSRPLPSNTGLRFARVADGSLYGAADNATATAVLVLSLKASDGSLNWQYQVADENVQQFLVAP